MKRFEEIVPGIYLLKVPFSTIWSAVYLVRGEKNVLIDSCTGQDAVDGCIIPALSELGLAPGDIDHLINTHAHGDHAGGNGCFIERSGCKLAAFETCVDKLRDPLKYNIATRVVYPEYSPKPAEYLPANEPDVILYEGGMLGDRLRVYTAPGHDTECIMLHDLKTNTLITGDSLQGFGMLGQDGAGVAFYKYLSDYRNTVEKAQALDPENIIASHDFSPMGCLALGRKEVRVYLDNCTQAMAIYDCLVRRLLASGVTDIAAIARSVLDSLGAEEPPYLFQTMYTVHEHVKEIQAEKA